MKLISERLVVVRNPNSTHTSTIESKVFNRLNDADISYEKYETLSPSAETNITDMQAVFREGDTVLVAGGDGTIMQVANAVLRSNLQEVAIGPLGFGNFNDLSKKQDPLTLLDTSARTIELQPLTIKVNNNYLRDAPGYMSLGLTALVASQFNARASREHLSKIPDWIKPSVTLGQLATTYFQVRDRKLPPFHTTLSPYLQRNFTDILAINSARAGRFIRSNRDYSGSDAFGLRVDNLSTILPNITFGIRALAGYTPADTVYGASIRFETPATLPFQSEGEYQELTDVTNIFIYKDPARMLHFLHPAP